MVYKWAYAVQAMSVHTVDYKIMHVLVTACNTLPLVGWAQVSFRY